MRNLVLVLICCFLVSGCGNEPDQNSIAVIAEADSQKATSYPLLIDDGKKVVYQFGRMTSNKGLKLYLDTISHTAGESKILELLKGE